MQDINNQRRYQHLQLKKENMRTYDDNLAKILSSIMMHLNITMAGMTDKQALSFLHTYTLKQAINRWGERARVAAIAEMRQIHDRVVFEPIDVNELTEEEKKRAMESLMFLTEKRIYLLRLAPVRMEVFNNLIYQKKKQPVQLHALNLLLLQE
mgnify:CR=1 FL=1